MMEQKLHEIKYLPLDKIRENAWNPNEMDSKSFDRLLKEIQMTGMISAIQVVPTEDGNYRIIGGAHRFKAAKELGFDEIAAVILSETQFKDEDVQKFLTVRLNMLSDDVDPEKFRVLYEEMADKYGAESLQNLFGVTDDDAWTSMTKAITRELRDAGIPKDKIKKALEEAGDDKSVDNLSRILNGIFSENADTLNTRGYMYFDFEGTTMMFVDVSKDVFKFFDELQINSDPKELENELRPALI